MKLFRGLANSPQFQSGCVATIGNFDGVHLGHQRLITQLKTKAKEFDVPCVVILFEPQPLEYFAAEKAPARLSSLREKLFLMKQLGIDAVWCLTFNEAFSRLSADAFCQRVLFDRLKIRYLSVGEDFRFGQGRFGDFQLLKTHCAVEDCHLEAMPTVIYGTKRRISSTWVREALSCGDLNQAKALLGRDFSLIGRVSHGDKRARDWGIPTANVLLKRLSVPIKGVYCVCVNFGGKVYDGVANVGTRPTIDGMTSLLEVHIFDFERDIYGELIEVKFVNKLRDEKKFASIEQLKQQILRDAEVAKQYFSLSNKPKSSTTVE